MKRIRILVLVAGFSLLVGGCGGSQGTGEASTSASSGQGQPAQASPSTDPAGPCLEGHGFTILNFRAVRDDYHQVSVVGEIKNTGEAYRGVELQASLRDPSGHIVAVGHFYPASYRNITPGDTWPFTYSFGRQEDAVDAELRIVGAFRTIDILNVATKP